MKSARCITMAIGLAAWAATSAVAQVDLGPLFATPTPGEIAAVESDWLTRPAPADVGFTIVRAENFGLFRGIVFSHLVNGQRHYVFVRLPRGFSSAGSYAVMIRQHGGASGTSSDAAAELDAAAGTCAMDQCIVLLPSYRGEELRIRWPSDGGAITRYQSEGIIAAQDTDADDVMWMLTSFLANAPQADPNRIGIWGTSRGAGVGYHVAARDSRIRLFIGFYGHTDDFGTMYRTGCEAVLAGGSSANEIVNGLVDLVITPYLAGTLSLADARLTMLRRSGLYFATHLTARVQIHHGSSDATVSVEDSRAANSLLLAQGRTAPCFEYYEYPGGLHSVSSLTGHEAFAGQAVCDLVSGAASGCAALCPVVSAQPIGRDACAAESVVLSVNAAGTGPLAYRWQIQDGLAPGGWADVIDGVVVRGGTGVATVSGAATPQLLCTLLPGVIGDVSWRCIVAGAAGCASATSVPAVISGCPADVNCTGGLSVQDIFDFLAAWFASDPTADFNGVGGISVQDIFDFLAAWFVGCP